MRQAIPILMSLVFIAAAVPAQQINTPLASLAVNADPASVVGMGPLSVQTFTDSPLTITVAGLSNVPLVLLHGVFVPGVMTDFGFSVDIGADGPGGSYAPNILLDGWSNPSPMSWTDGAGRLSLTLSVPSCTTTPTGSLACNLPAAFNHAVQAILPDPTAPLGVRSTAATALSFTNGYTQLTLSANGFAPYDFLGGFTFAFYGQQYTRIYVSANGYISFTPPPTAPFPNPSVNGIRNGVPRIMSFYSDLEPQIPLPGSRVYVQQSEQGGLRRVRVVHERLAEFGNASGPHGGEIVLEESGGIGILVSPYNAAPTINVAVGICPGGGIDSGSPPAPGQTPWGRNLTADTTTPGGVTLPPLRAAFELFDQGNTPPANPLDLIAFNLGGGGVWFRPLPGTAVPNDTYTITLM